MGQDRVALSPAQNHPLPHQRGKGSGTALRPECPPAALWAYALGKGLAIWPLWSWTLCAQTTPHPSVLAQYQPLPLWAWARGIQVLTASSLVLRLLLGPLSPPVPPPIHSAWCVVPPGLQDRSGPTLCLPQSPL
jgi:hypothetical protein